MLKLLFSATDKLFANCRQDMVPALVDAIKSHGLALVTDKSSDSPDASPMTDPFPRPPKGVDGVLKSHGILRFNDSIDM